MKKNPYKGKFIVFEGIDGSGSTTQAELLFKYLKNKGGKVYLTSEPTNFAIGGLIQSQLSGDWKTSPECLQLLFTADRAFHLQKEIIPLLEKGVTVICTRYILSTLAYGNLNIKDKNWLIEINKNFILPDFTFLLKVPARVCIKRIERERFHKELFEKEKKLEKVLNNYLKLIKKFRNSYILNGEKQVQEISEEIIKIISNK